MLSLLHRHILKEILVATGLAMGLFIFVLLVGNALRDVAELVVAGKLDFWVFIKVLGLFIPYVASFALPLGMLTGTLIALGRLSSQREITAMKSAGLSLYQIAAPVFLIAFAGMSAAVLINLHYAPQSRVERKALMAEALTDNPVGFIEERRFIYDFPGYVIYMGGREGSVMKDFWIWELDDQKRAKLFLRSAEGILGYDEVNKDLILTLKDGTAEQRESENPEAFSDNMPDSLFFGELPIAHSEEFCLGLFRLFAGRIWRAAGHPSRAQGDLCQPWYRASYCDDLLFPHHYGQLVGGYPFSQARSVDMVTKFDFSGSRLLDDLSCESSLIMG